MSVIIKGINVPESCNKCPFAELDILYALWTCKFSGGDVTEELFSNAYSFRPEWCPVGELPEKYERLIDAEEET